MVNKKAWIKIVEAFIGIMLITGIMLMILNRESIGTDQTAVRIYQAEEGILREIQLNNSLREIILTEPLNVEWNISENIKNKIPNYLDCKANICELNSACTIDINTVKDVYVQSTAITTDLNTQNYDLRKVVLFCWVR